jgi:hypothetical protein
MPVSLTVNDSNYINVNGNPGANYIPHITTSQHNIVNGNINITLPNNSAAFIENDLNLSYTNNLKRGTNNGIGYMVRDEKNNYTYVAGSFTIVENNIPAINLARWDGTNWISLGFTGGNVQRLALDNSGNLYIVCAFTNDGNYLWKWDGQQMTCLIGSELNIPITIGEIKVKFSFGLYSIAFDSSNVMYLTLAWAYKVNEDGEYMDGSWLGNPIIKYDEYSKTGEFVGDGLFDGNAHLIVFDKYDNLYVGGAFGTIIKYIDKTEKVVGTVVRLNKSSNTWEGLNNSVNHFPRVIKFDNDNKMYLGGVFTEDVSGTVLNRIATLDFDNQIWTPLGDGFNHEVYDIGISSTNKVYAGGMFNLSGNSILYKLAAWENNTWNVITNDIIQTNSTFISKILLDVSDNIYICGEFKDDVNSNNVCQFVKGDIDAVTINLSVNNKFLKSVKKNQTTHAIVAHDGKVYNLGVVNEAI